MGEKVHHNFIKSSNLIFGTVGLGLVNFFFSGVSISSMKNILLEIFTIIITSGIALLTRQGKGWVKYFLFVLTTLGGIVAIPILIDNFSFRPLFVFISITETILQIWAVIILFSVPKNNKVKANSV